MLTPREQIKVQLAWFLSIGVDRFDIGVRQHSGTFIKRHANVFIKEVEGLLGWLRAENAKGSDIYLRPARGYAWPAIFLDDVSLSDARLQAVQTNALVVETSPDSCHVWLHADRELNESQRAEVQKRLSAMPGSKGRLSDPASTSGEHWGRMAGFKNNKEGRNCWVNLRNHDVSEATLPVGFFLIEDGPNPIGSSSKIALAAPCRSVASSGRDASLSGNDWAMVMSALEHGYPASNVTDALYGLASQRGKRAPEEYAERTVQKALAVLRNRRCDKGNYRNENFNVK